MEKIRLYPENNNLLVNIEKFQKNEINSVEEMQNFIVQLIIYSKEKLRNEDSKMIDNLFEELKRKELENRQLVKKLEKNQKFYEEIIRNLELEIFEHNERIIMLKESIQVKNEKIRMYRTYYENNYN